MWPRREPSPPGSPGPCAKPSAASSAGPPRFGEPPRLAPPPRGVGKYEGDPRGSPAGVGSRHVNGDEGDVKNTQQSPPRLGVAPPRLGARHPLTGAGVAKRSWRGPGAPPARRRPAGRKTTAPARFLRRRNVVSVMFRQRARQDAPDDVKHERKGKECARRRVLAVRVVALELGRKPRLSKGSSRAIERHRQRQHGRNDQQSNSPDRPIRTARGPLGPASIRG